MTINTTPQYGLPWPDNTEAVANGWDAIRDLAVAAEAAMAALPQGELAAAAATACVTSATGVTTDIPGMSVAPTLPAGRRIRVSGKATIKQQATGLTFLQLRDGAGVVLDETFDSLTGGDFTTMLIDYSFTSVAGPITLKASLLSSVGSCETALGGGTGRYGQLVVEDLGAA